MCLVFTRMPSESYGRRLKPLLFCLCDAVFRAVINSLCVDSKHWTQKQHSSTKAGGDTYTHYLSLSLCPPPPLSLSLFLSSPSPSLVHTSLFNTLYACVPCSVMVHCALHVAQAICKRPTLGEISQNRELRSGCPSSLLSDSAMFTHKWRHFLVPADGIGAP